MSRKVENRCVDCGLPCIGTSCPNYKVPVYYCDDCKYETAKYRLDKDELCETCAEERIKSIFEALTLSEQAEVLDVDLESIYG